MPNKDKAVFLVDGVRVEVWSGKGKLYESQGFQLSFDPTSNRPLISKVGHKVALYRGQTLVNKRFVWAETGHYYQVEVLGHTTKIEFVYLD